MKNTEHDIREKLDMSTFMNDILDNSRIGCILILDSNGIILDISKGIEESFGYTLDDLYGKHFSVFYSENDLRLNKPDNELKEAIENGYGLDDNYLIHKNGEHIWCRCESILVNNAEIGNIYFIKYVYDINRQKQLETSLIEAKKFSEGITETIHEALLVLDTNLNILVTNSAFQRNFNWNNIDLLGKPFFELNDQGWDVPRLRVLFEKLLPESSYVKNFELEFDCPSKGKLILNLNAKQLLEHGKKQQKILIFITDITSQKKDSENLSFENKELNSINKDLDTFVYTASHDLKAPVNNLKGLIKALKEEEDTKARNELMDMVDISLEKLNSAISDLAKTGRAKKSQGEASSLIYFEKIVEDVKEFLKNEIQESNAIIIEDFTYAPTLFFSRKNLRSLFQNLISNAIKYRYSDRNTEIQISSAQQEEYILLQITDNSIEIKEEDKAKVFEMDQRLHTHVEDKEVGLGIVARIINNSGGKIEIDSEQGKGNTFKIYFKV